MVYVTGDLHGYYGRIVRFCASLDRVGPDDVLVVLGDVGANYWCDESDLPMRDALASLPLTVLCVHGNHEARPGAGLGYVRAPWRGGEVFVDPARPRLLFAACGSVFDLEGERCLVVGGAASVDRDHRLEDGRRWFPDEQPGPAERARAEASCAACGWEVDYVMTHTCPLHLLPAEGAKAAACRERVDLSTERWLDGLEGRLSYKRWMCGHFHLDSYGSPVFWVLHRDVVELQSGTIVYSAAADSEALAAAPRFAAHVVRPASKQRPGTAGLHL
jgi:3-oxoacid CoA-transferase subunit A